MSNLNGRAQVGWGVSGVHRTSSTGWGSGSQALDPLTQLPADLAFAVRERLKKQGWILANLFSPVQDPVLAGVPLKYLTILREAAGLEAETLV